MQGVQEQAAQTAALVKRITALERAASRPAAATGVEVTEWTPVTYTNSWVDYGSGYQGVEYRKVGDIVYLRGLMRSGTEAVAFTLPVGFRPPANVSFATMCGGNEPCLAILFTDGTYVPDFGAGFSIYYVVNHQFSVTA